MRLCLVAGARPNFMKIAPIIDAIASRNSREGVGVNGLQYRLVHTGQHYDSLMSKVFFDELGLPVPDINLEVGSGSHAVQTAEIMKRFEEVCLEEKPTHILVVGDVNSTIACALVAVKLGIKVIHVEAGLRSFDRTMPEEINRILTDAISDYLFITEEEANTNLFREGVKKERIHFVGNVMIDTLLKHREKADLSTVLERFGLRAGPVGHAAEVLTSPPLPGSNSDVFPYAVLTLHRPANVDDYVTFRGILDALKSISMTIPIIFPVHPRTVSRIKEFGFQDSVRDLSMKGANCSGPDKGICLLPPLGYLDFLKLMSSAKLVLTDSGGIQEETTILGVPCVTIRENTERPVTISHGTNILAGIQTEQIVEAAYSQLDKGLRTNSVPPLWDGKAAERIVDILFND